MPTSYPTAWHLLTSPEERAELLDSLDELKRSDRIALWFAPPSNVVVGIDEVFHFFFDDHNFDFSAIGYSLFDDQELAAVADVKNALDAILKTNKKGNSRYFVDHSGWPHVVNAANAAYAMLAEKGLPKWS